jgi:hypothetical protein
MVLDMRYVVEYKACIGGRVCSWKRQMNGRGCRLVPDPERLKKQDDG